MIINATPFAGLFEIQQTAFKDGRGHFTRLFCQQELSKIRENIHFVQINFSHTLLKGSLRGMHCQESPAAEAKLVRCLSGTVLDVVVDIREKSPTFLKYYAVELSADNDRAIFIPEGFAHGFQALTDDASLLYMHTEFWSPNQEFGIRYDDPRISIDWPLSITHCSERDLQHPFLDAKFTGLKQ